MIKLLPNWILANTNTNAAFYDTESATAIEQTAKLYAKVQELINEYNQFAEDVNAEITAFKGTTAEELEVFTIGLRQEFQDFIDVINLKIMGQDEKIDVMIEYLTNNLKDTVEQLLLEGKINVGFVYEENEEEITLVTIPLDSANSIVYTSEVEKIDII